MPSVPAGSTATLATTATSEPDVVINKVLSKTYTFNKERLVSSGSEDDIVLLKEYTDGSYLLYVRIMTTEAILPGGVVPVLDKADIYTDFKIYRILGTLNWSVFLGDKVGLELENTSTETIGAETWICFTCPIKTVLLCPLKISSEVSITQADNTTLPNNENVITELSEWNPLSAEPPFAMNYCRIRTNNYDSTYYEVFGQFQLIEGELCPLTIVPLVLKGCFRSDRENSLYIIFDGSDYIVILTSAGLFIMTKTVITTYKPIEFKGSFYLHDGDSIITSFTPDMSIYRTAAEENQIRRLLIHFYLENSFSANGKTYELRITSDYNQNRLYFTRLSDHIYHIAGLIKLRNDVVDGSRIKNVDIKVLNLVSNTDEFGGRGLAYTVDTEIGAPLPIQLYIDTNQESGHTVNATLCYEGNANDLKNAVVEFALTITTEAWDYANAFEYVLLVGSTNSSFKYTSTY